MRYIHHLIDDQKFKFVSDLDEIGHYEIISLNGRSNSDRPDNRPPSGHVVRGPSRYAGTDESSFPLSGSEFFCESDKK